MPPNSTRPRGTTAPSGGLVIRMVRGRSTEMDSRAEPSLRRPIRMPMIAAAIVASAPIKAASKVSDKGPPLRNKSAQRSSTHRRAPARAVQAVVNRRPSKLQGKLGSPPIAPWGSYGTSNTQRQRDHSGLRVLPCVAGAPCFFRSGPRTSQLRARRFRVRAPGMTDHERRQHHPESRWR